MIYKKKSVKNISAQNWIIGSVSFNINLKNLTLWEFYGL